MILPKSTAIVSRKKTKHDTELGLKKSHNYPIKINKRQLKTDKLIDILTFKICGEKIFKIEMR